jgi:hypothetical protein
LLHVTDDKLIEDKLIEAEGLSAMPFLPLAAMANAFILTQPHY